MKIIPTTQIAGIEQYGKIKQKASVTESQQLGTDQITFSSDATLFSETLKAAKQDLNVRLAGANINLDEIKNEIANGSYEVDSNDLAESLMMLQGYYERK